jgi:hypothetical protein
MSTEGLLTKEQIGRELNPDDPLGVRSVERYIALAGVEPAVKGKGRGHQSKYSRADVAKIVEAYRTAQERQQQPGQALARTTPGGLDRAAALVEMMSEQAEGFARVVESNERLREVADSWPVWMSKAQATERAGIPASYFDAGVRAGELPHIGGGTGRRYHREDVRAFAARMREPGFIEGLLKKARAGKRKAKSAT